MPRINSTAELEELRKGILSGRDPQKPCITICAGMGCHSLDNGRVTGCHGYCEKGPLVVIYPGEICYVEVTPGDVPEIITQTVLGKKVLDRLVYTDPGTGEKAVHLTEIPFYRKQVILKIRSCFY